MESSKGFTFIHLFRNADKICRRQLKEGHHAVSPVDSVCSQISEIGQHGHKV